jgi:hypothetical protein
VDIDGLDMRACLLGLGLLVVGCSSQTIEIPSSGVPPTTTPESSEAAPRDPPQTAFNAEAGGCGSIFVYRANADGTQYAVVAMNQRELGLAIGESRSIDLGGDPAGIKVNIDVYARPPNTKLYCSEVAQVAPAVAHWPAEAGLATIDLVRDETDASTYRVSIRLEHMHFTSPEGGMAAVVPQILIEDVRVGWSP